MLKKHYLVTKKIFQVILYLTEMIGISYLLTKITSIYLPTENFIDFFERMTIFFYILSDNYIWNISTIK